MLTGREKGLNKLQCSQVKDSGGGGARDWVSDVCEDSVEVEVCEWKKQGCANISKNPTSRRIIMSFICWCYIPCVIGVALPTPQTKTPTEKGP